MEVRDIKHNTQSQSLSIIVMQIHTPKISVEYLLISEAYGMMTVGTNHLIIFSADEVCLLWGSSEVSMRILKSLLQSII